MRIGRRTRIYRNGPNWTIKRWWPNGMYAASHAPTLRGVWRMRPRLGKTERPATMLHGDEITPIATFTHTFDQGEHASGGVWYGCGDADDFTVGQ